MFSLAFFLEVLLLSLHIPCQFQPLLSFDSYLHLCSTRALALYSCWVAHPCSHSLCAPVLEFELSFFTFCFSTASFLDMLKSKMGSLKVLRQQAAWRNCQNVTPSKCRLGCVQAPLLQWWELSCENNLESFVHDNSWIGCASITGLIKWGYRRNLKGFNG